MIFSGMGNFGELLVVVAQGVFTGLAYVIGMKVGATAAMGQALADEVIQAREKEAQWKDPRWRASKYSKLAGVVDLSPAERAEAALRGVTLTVAESRRLNEVLVRSTMGQDDPGEA